MADINAVDLTAETLSSLDGTENVVGFDTAEGKKIPLSVLADYVVQKKTQTLAGATQTPQNAVNAVNDSVSVPTYSTVEALHTAVTGITSLRTAKLFSVSSDVTYAISNGQGSGAARGIAYKADGATIDCLLFGLATEKIIIARIGANATITKSIVLPTRVEIDAKPNATKGTWTPTFERLTASNVSGRYTRIGDLVVATASFTISSLSGGNPYIPSSALPVSLSGISPIGGTWAGGAGETGDLCNTTNNNLWFHKNGVAHSLANEVDKNVNISIMYIVP